MVEYDALEEYALVGNLETCALVGRGGSVDWLPVSHVEDPSVFARILDAENGGHFRIHPLGFEETRRGYLHGTNVVQTAFESRDGTVTVTDFLPVDDDRPLDRALIRRVECTEGADAVDATFRPRFDYARAEPTIEVADGRIHASGGGQSIALGIPEGVDPEVDPEAGEVWCRLGLSAGDVGWFVLGWDHERVDPGRDPPSDPATIDLPDPDRCAELLARTVDYWQGWSHTCEDGRDCRLAGPWHDLAVRSELVLKLLTHHDSGTVAAAPTTSLPETIGGVRNWDYRYNWLRDSAFTIQSLTSLGHVAEARAYNDWVLDLCRHRDPGELQPLYGLHGEEELPERTLDHLDGYRKSRPVRIGNEAAEQLQLDIYGEVVLGIYETVRVTDDGHLDRDDWAVVRDLVDHVCTVWDQKDASIWEVRGPLQHFVFSKVMCWVALDRGLAMADELGYPAPREKWTDHRDRIEADVLARGYDPEVGSFLQAYESDALDATALLLPAVGFVPFDDDRVTSTVDAIQDRLVAEDGLVRRYDGDDGLPGEEGAFCLCSCWLVDALALSGRVEEAVDLFVDLLSYVNDVGLLAEEVDPIANVQLGNFPQAFSHLGIVNSALTLSHVLDGDGDDGDPVALDLGQEFDLPTEPIDVPDR